MNTKGAIRFVLLVNKLLFYDEIYLMDRMNIISSFVFRHFLFYLVCVFADPL